jgi:hypothetical protein
MNKLLVVLLLLFAFACKDNPGDNPGENSRHIYLHAYDYARNYFFLDTAYLDVYNDTYKGNVPVVPLSAAPLRIKEIEVWRSEADTSTIPGRLAIAWAGLYPLRLKMGDHYPSCVKEPSGKPGEMALGSWEKLDSAEYSVDWKLGILKIKDLRPERYYAVSYRIEAGANGPDDDLYYGTMSNTIGHKDMMILKLVFFPNMQPGYNILWKRQLKNYYSFNTTNIDLSKTSIRIYYITANNDTLEMPDGMTDKLVTALGCDKTNPLGQPSPDGIYDLRLPYFDRYGGSIMIPNLKPFDDGIRSYLAKINRTDLVDKYIYPEVYNSTVEEAKAKTDKDRYLIVIERNE